MAGSAVERRRTGGREKRSLRPGAADLAFLSFERVPSQPAAAQNNSPKGFPFP